jgi:hypothetical protein
MASAFGVERSRGQEGRSGTENVEGFARWRGKHYLKTLTRRLHGFNSQPYSGRREFLRSQENSH